MTFYQWPSDEGWPYPDGVETGSVPERPDLDSSIDDDALVLRAAPPHLFDRLEPLERQVITSHYGLAGDPPLTMKQLHNEWGLPRADLREALASGLAKLRTRLRD
ncbi:MAG: hypothetical protein ACRD0Q_07075 [Acidimicrobiales bacterium]